MLHIVLLLWPTLVLGECVLREQIFVLDSSGSFTTHADCADVSFDDADFIASSVAQITNTCPDQVKTLWRRIQHDHPGECSPRLFILLVRSDEGDLDAITANSLHEAEELKDKIEERRHPRWETVLSISPCRLNRAYTRPNRPPNTPNHGLQASDKMMKLTFVAKGERNWLWVPTKHKNGTYYDVMYFIANGGGNYLSAETSQFLGLKGWDIAHLWNSKVETSVEYQISRFPFADDPLFCDRARQQVQCDAHNECVWNGSACHLRPGATAPDDNVLGLASSLSALEVYPSGARWASHVFPSVIDHAAGSAPNPHKATNTKPP